MTETPCIECPECGGLGAAIIGDGGYMPLVGNCPTCMGLGVVSNPDYQEAMSYDI